MGCACSSAESAAPVNDGDAHRRHSNDATAQLANGLRAAHGRDPVYRDSGRQAPECAEERESRSSFDLDSCANSATCLTSFTARQDSSSDGDILATVPRAIDGASGDTNSHGRIEREEESVMDLFVAAARSGYAASDKPVDEADDDNDFAIKLPPPRAQARDGGFFRHVNVPARHTAQPALALWQ